jgi:hypothetical protein
MPNGRCAWDGRCLCPATEGRRALNGCDDCPIDKAMNLPDNETLLMYDVPQDWRPTLKDIKKLPVCSR